MHPVFPKIILVVPLVLMIIGETNGQAFDSLKTGYLLDHAEEYWPLQKDFLSEDGTKRVKHILVNHNRGFITSGVSVRESYEYFNNYLWGLGIQDRNGYFLHRLLPYTDIRWNNYLRMFTELQSSMIWDRTGGPRPIQDMNELAINQIFGEISIATSKTSVLRLRVGKQSLNYGQGTLLDIRDANVRRSFVGYKVIVENRLFKLDIFFMQPIAEMKGAFDDKINPKQKVGGFWATRKVHSNSLAKLDFYYLLISRGLNRFNQGSGQEVRNTFGAATSFKKANWFSYSEIDLQFGRFGQGRIRAWKIASSLGYQIQTLGMKPSFSIQGAISSGDKDSTNLDLQTFNPLYPKAIYYGAIDNTGSANLIVAHPKAEFLFLNRLKVVMGHYRFWRQRSEDGVYAINGAYLLPAANDKMEVGSMWDITLTYIVGNHFTILMIGSYYKRAGYLKQQLATHSDIRYLGIKATLRI